MTGWRLGWAVGKHELIAAMAKVKNYVDTGAFLAVQAAGAAVLGDAEEIIRGYVAQFRERRDAMVPALAASGFDAEGPRAAPYVWGPLPEGLGSGAVQRPAVEEGGGRGVAGSGLRPRAGGV